MSNVSNITELKKLNIKKYTSFPDGIPFRGNYYPRFVTHHFHELI